MSSFVLTCLLTAAPAAAPASYDTVVNDYLTQSQQSALARTALAQYAATPDAGHGPEVDLRMVFPASQTGLDNIEMTMLEPVGPGAHECMAIAVKTGGQSIESYFHSQKDVRPGQLYNIVVSDSMGDKYWVGRILVDRSAVQRYLINAPLLGPGSTRYDGPNSAPAPQIGIFGENVTPQLLRRASVSRTVRGVFVVLVMANTNAQRWGLRVGDLIVALNGHAVDSMAQVEHFAQPSAMRFTLLRGGRLLRLGPTGNVGTSGIPSYASPQGEALIKSWAVPVPSLGLSAITITPQLLQMLHARPEYSGFRGIIVLQVQPNSWASSAGFEGGDVVTAVDGRSFATVDDFLSLVREFWNALRFSLIRNNERLTLSAGGSNGWQPPVVGPGFVPPATPRP